MNRLSPRAPERIRALFAGIVCRYDLANRVMSLGLDMGWRAVAADRGAAAPPGPVLDLGTGTGDLALTVARRSRHVVGIDFCRPMLQAAQAKILRTCAGPLIALAESDALILPFADATFAAVMAGFSLRNVADLGHVLREARRVTVNGGRFICLEMTPPQRLRWAHWVYQMLAMPALGALVGGQWAAYRYLPVSIRRFPHAETLRHLIEQAGWRNVRYQTLALGAVTVHVAERP